MKVLNEDNNNEYAKAVHKVEELMRKNEVSIDYMGVYLLIRIKDREFRLDNGASFPRTFEEERLEVIK